AQPSLCIGRYEGTESLRGRRGYPQRCAAITTQVVTAPQDVCGAARCVGTCARKSRQNTRPTVDCARPWKAENNENNPLTGVVCLLTKGVLIRVRLGMYPPLTPDPMVCLRMSVPQPRRALLRRPIGSSRSPGTEASETASGPLPSRS